MPMPSLFKYFAFVGTALLAMITLANFLLDPSTGAHAVVSQAKVTPAVQHDPRASKVERWRNEQAALKAAAQTQTAENASLVTKSELAPPPRQQAVVSEPAQPVQTQPAQAQPAQAQPAQAQPAQAQPVQAQPAEPALQTADVSAEHDAELAQAKAEKARAAKAAKAARKAKLARDRARTDQLAREGGQGQPQQGWQQGQNQFYSGVQQRSASNQQDQFYYGQRAPAQQGPGYAYAPRPNYGPFGGFGGRW